MIKTHGSIAFLLAFLAVSIIISGKKSHFEASFLSSPIDSIDYRVELGKRFFYEKAFSRDSSISCASCHKPELAFTDGKPQSIGIKNRVGQRNSPTLTNVGNRPYLLLDGVNPGLEQQITAPIQEHAEFDFHVLLIVDRLKQNPEYVELAEKAYQKEIDHQVIFSSIATFERTLISNNSAFDQYLNGDKKALSKAQKRGKKLFFNKLHCTKCHVGNDLTNDMLTNNGLYTVYADSGRMRLTEKEQDRAIFKVPTLRNIALTAPYMHNGSVESLEEVIDHYSSGGKPHPHKHPAIQPFDISEKEKQDLIAFLKSLTDTTFTNNPAFRY